MSVEWIRKTIRKTFTDLMRDLRSRDLITSRVEEDRDFDEKIEQWLIAIRIKALTNQVRIERRGNQGVNGRADSLSPPQTRPLHLERGAIGPKSQHLMAIFCS